jgi:hypothetical protein
MVQQGDGAAVAAGEKQPNVDNGQLPKAHTNGENWKALLLLLLEGILLVLVAFFVSLAVIDFLGLLKPFRIGPTAYRVKVLDPPIQTSAPLEEAVFFKNGDAVLSDESKKLLSFIAKLTKCQGAALKITPWVSGAEYKNDPKGEKNFDLARRRAKAVTDYFVTNKSLHISGKDWGSFRDIRDHILINDARSDPHRESNDEQFNRRVDIRVEKGCTATAVPAT